jgi:hypothetical protein
MYRYIGALALFAAVACDDKGGDSGSSVVVDSCNWTDLNVCFEYEDYDGTQTWCSDIGDDGGFATEYIAGPCPADEIGACALGVGGDFDHEATAYYYSGTTDPDQSCLDAGGTPI